MRPARWGRCLRSGPISPHLTGSSWWPTAGCRFGRRPCWSWLTAWPSCDPRVQHTVARVSRRLRHECQGDHVIVVSHGDGADPRLDGKCVVVALLTRTPDMVRKSVRGQVRGLTCLLYTSPSPR